MKKKKQSFKRFFAMLLSLVMLMTSVQLQPLNVQAEESSTSTYYKVDDVSELSAGEEPVIPGQPGEVTVSTIADTKAMAADATATVKGTVIFVDGKNVVVQDSTGGINLYFTTAPTDIAIGDVVQATGTRATFNGLEQLKNVTEYSEDDTAELPAAETTIAAILADQETGLLESTCVVIKNAVIGAINTSGNTTMTVGDSTINIYKIPALDGIGEGDTVNVTAVISDYNGYQLRVADVAGVELVKKAEVTEPEQPDDPQDPVDGITWTKVTLSEIAETDTVAITMSKEGTTWVLPNVGNGNSKQPLAVTGTVTDDVLTTDVAETYSWNIKAVEGSYNITSGDNYLYLTATNNGMRIGTTVAVWNITGGYLNSVDSKGETRYVGVYNSQDWRCYTSINNQISGQTLEFWKLGGSTKPEEVTGMKDGTYVIYDAKNMKAAKALAEDKTYGYFQPADVTLTDGVVSGYGKDAAWTIKNISDGRFTIVDANGRYVYMSGTYNSFNVSDSQPESGYLWTAVANEDGTVKLMNVEMSKYISYDETYSSFGAYAEPSDTQKANLTLVSFVEPEEEEPDVGAAGIADGDYVIWAPAYNMALSSNYNGSYYNPGVKLSVSGNSVSGYGNSEIWTVTNNADGTITISCSGGKLAMDTDHSSMPLDAVNDTWTLEDAGNGQYYVKNVGRGCYIEWYKDKSYWSGYYSISASSEGMFALKFTPAEKGLDVDSSIVEAIASWGGGGAYNDTDNAAVIKGDRYTSGDQLDANAEYTVVVSGVNVKPYSTSTPNTGGTSYYMGGKGIGSGSNDYAQFAVNTAGWGNMELSFRMRASNTAPGSFQLCYSKDGGNTWVNFTEGTYKYAYTSYDGEGESYVVEGDGAISDGIAKTSMAPANYITFTFAVPSGADNCENLLIRMVPGTDAAKAGGTIKNTGVIRVDSVVLAGSPIVDSSITGYVAVTPDGAEDQAVGTELTMESATEGATICYRVNGGNWATYNAESKPTLADLPCNVEAYAVSDGRAKSVVLVYTYAAGSVATVKFTPNGGGVYIEGESSEIVLSSDTADATIYYATSEDGIVFSDYAEYTAPIVIEKGFGKLSVKAYAHKDGYKDSIEVIRDFTERSSDEYKIYFGQMHAHTNISDGSGDIKEAFEHASNVKNLDFLAVTDHSNSFDNDGSGVLAEDGSSVSSEWKLGHDEARNITSEDFVGLYGYEMTWSNGLGHMNTFNSPGWQSRTQNDYKTYGTALQNYYTALATVPASISQFNHPGTTFGDFSDFAHYTEERDDLITLIEVGNGEGAIGSSGYFPSYEYYTRALDKGWHVAPTNNQDNHKGLWGDANTGRSVVLVDSLTETNIYDAMRNYRVYATEDNDLGIYYTLDGNIMGTILDSSDVGGTVKLSVALADPTDSANATVSVIVNGGYAAASQTATCNDTVTFSVPSSYNYYYIKVVQADGDIAVTAPVWIGKVEAVGVSSLTAASDLTIAGEKQTFNLELFNNEKKDLLVSSLVFTNKDTGEVIYTDSTISQVGAESTAACTFDHIFDENGIYTIRATVKGTLNGVEKTYTQDLEITVMPAEITSKVIVDGTHFNDYVTGYYGGNTGNMTTIAAAQGIKVHVETEKITAEMLADCSLLVISAPAKKTGTANAGDYTASLFEEDFIDTVKGFVENGGSVIVCGLADYQDKGAPSADYHTAAQLNKLLAAIGSSLRINDDEAYDEENNGGQAYRLYPSVFNSDSKWCNGLVEGQTYSQYSGCTVDAGNGTWLVKGFDTTYSIDSDGDGVGGLEKGNAVFIAAEDTEYGGTVFASGGVFVSDFEVKAELDNMWDLPYANRTIYENILGITRKMPEITPIAEVRQSAAVALGEIFVVEGYVTAGTANPNTKFFDTIYLQDDTGGITIFPYSELGLELGTKMRITGNTEHYQGDFEIQIMSYEILDAAKKIIDPEEMSAKAAMDYDNNGGKLIKVQGEVDSVTMSNGVVSEFVVKDEQGDEAKVFIDGYILSGTTGKNELAGIVKEGNTVSAVGLSYLHPEGDSEVSVCVLRVRDCDEIILIKEGPGTGTGGNNGSGSTSGSGTGGSSSANNNTTSDKPESNKPVETIPAPNKNTTTNKVTTNGTTVTKPVTSEKNDSEELTIPTEDMSVDSAIVEETANEAIVGIVKQEVEVVEGKATVSTETINKIIEVTETGSTVILPLKEAARDDQEVNEVIVPAAAITKMIERDASVTMEFEKAKVFLSIESLKVIAEQAKGKDVEIRVVEMTHHELNEKQQKALEGKETELCITVQIHCDGEYIGDFKGGKAMLAIPFTPRDGRSVDYHKVYFVADDGHKEVIPFKYANGHMIIAVGHFSEYVIVYEGADIESEDVKVSVDETVLEDDETAEVDEKGGLLVVPMILVILVFTTVIIYMKKRKGNQ